MTEEVTNELRRDRPTSDELKQIAHSLSGLRFGSVTIVVQDGVIIQIDRTEKRRIRSRAAAETNNRAHRA